MSYAAAAALQTAIYDRLIADIALSALVGGAIYDALPEETKSQLEGLVAEHCYWHSRALGGGSPLDSWPLRAPFWLISGWHGSYDM